MEQPKLSIIMPVHNEKDYILNTLNTLLKQTDRNDTELPTNTFQLVIVNNASTDNTTDLIKDFQKNNKLFKCFIIERIEKGCVSSRITGYNFILNNSFLTTDILASMDADVSLHPLWVSNVISKYEDEHFDLLSNAGCFPLEFWKKVPDLASKYLDEIGTIFFNSETINWLGVRGKSFWFTEQVFFDFTRLITDQCFAIARKTYESVGGYTLDFLDKGKKIEFTDEGGRLSAKIERTGAKIIYSNEAPYTASPRRILGDPVKFLGGKLYDVGYMDKVFRSFRGDEYERLNQMALHTDYTGIRKYIIKNYILLKCITRPNLIIRNQVYFGKIVNDLVSEINSWWKHIKKLDSGREAMEFAELLTSKYYEKIMHDLPKQKVP